MRTLFVSLTALSLLAAPDSSLAQGKVERPVLSLSGASFRPLPLAIASVIYAAPSANREAGQEVESTLDQDLGVSGLFDLLDRKSFLADPHEGVTLAEIKFSRWQDVGAEGLIKVAISGADPVTLELHLYSAVLGREELRRRLSGPAAKARRMAHQLADEIFNYYTREPGAFQTRLAFVRKVKGLKQIFVSDWDGRNESAVTKTSMNLLPAWAPKGNRLAFTSYQAGNPDLLLLDLSSNKADVLFHRASALATGVCFGPDGKRVAFALSEDDGNSQIWVASASGDHLKRLTEGFGINSSPSFSPDGEQIVFVSNRAGTPQLYIVPAQGGAPKRITFQGNYNQTPDWSSRGDLIAFTARDERNAFDIFTVDPGSGKVTRLTQGQGNNEEPSFSPNGRLIAFTSTRTGKRQLYVMSADGNSQRQMTFGDEVFTPAWGPFPANP
jgi:TolB protein